VPTASSTCDAIIIIKLPPPPPPNWNEAMIKRRKIIYSLPISLTVRSLRWLVFPKSIRDSNSCGAYLFIYCVRAPDVRLPLDTTILRKIPRSYIFYILVMKSTRHFHRPR
jgi:hypothetical protein